MKSHVDLLMKHLSQAQAREVAKRLTAREGQIVHFRDDGTLLAPAPGVVAELERLGGEVYRCRRLGGTVEVDAVDAMNRPKTWEPQ